jgi:hypothetical protein
MRALGLARASTHGPVRGFRGSDFAHTFEVGTRMSTIAQIGRLTRPVASSHVHSPAVGQGGPTSATLIAEGLHSNAVN